MLNRHRELSHCRASLPLPLSPAPRMFNTPVPVAAGCSASSSVRANESIEYMVVEQGAYLDGAGHLYQAGLIEVKGSTWSVVSPVPYPHNKSVALGQVQTYFDANYVKPRMKPKSWNHGEGSFSVKLEQNEAAKKAHGLEVVGWFTMEEGKARPAQTPRHVTLLVRKCTCLWASTSLAQTCGNPGTFSYHRAHWVP